MCDALPARSTGARAGPSMRLRMVIRGAVQGVGFRPFIYRLAHSLGLTGWVSNSTQGVFIEAEGNQAELEAFLLNVTKEKPPRACIQSLESSFLDPRGYTFFEIRDSRVAGEKATIILPDIATCADCLAEIFNPACRRYQYPFISCTNCGPRFSIIEALPYDRSHTTMKNFVMCGQCRTEYGDPNNRRFHAQPNACPVCGPHLELWNAEGLVLATNHEALLAAADAIATGRIVAMKGLGGFQLLASAGNEETLRRRKHREEKPLAMMYPNFDMAQRHCEISELERRLLLSPEAPIVLLRRKRGDPPSDITPLVAPANPYYGVMLPYTPLHHLLMAELKLPIVATSGNLSDEPICIDEREALRRLGGIADLFLVHNRPIARHVDDSIVRLMMGRELVLRRARGYAPLPVTLKQPVPSILAVGAHLKNTIAFAAGSQVFTSQHIGDLESAQAFAAFRRVVGDFQSLYEIRPVALACDQHPEYLSTKFAQHYELAGRADRCSSAQPEATNQISVIGIQHHYAHVASCMAENELEGPVLGISWDGAGYGLDGPEQLVPVVIPDPQPDIVLGNTIRELKFTVNTTGSRPGRKTIQGQVKLIETNTGRVIDANTIGNEPVQVTVQTPARIRITETRLAQVFNGDSVNTNQVFQVRVKFNNTGEEGLDGVWVRLASNGSSEIRPEVVQAAGDSAVFEVEAYRFPSPHEKFTASIDSAIASNTNTRAAVGPPEEPGDDTTRVVIMTPAFLQLLSVTTDLNANTVPANSRQTWHIFVALRASQNPERNRSHVRLDAPLSLGLSLGGRPVGKDYDIDLPSELSGGGLFLRSGQADTLTYTVTKVGPDGGELIVTATAPGRDVTDLRPLLVSRNDTIQVLSQTLVSISNTQFAAGVNQSGGIGLVNQNQVFEVEVHVQNIGFERVDSAFVSIEKTAGNAGEGEAQIIVAKDTILAIPNPGVRIGKFRINAGSLLSANGDFYEFKVRIDSARTPSATATIGPPLNSDEVKFKVQSPAQLEVQVLEGPELCFAQAVRTRCDSERGLQRF